MRQPKVGEVIYAISHPQNRVGETEFLCLTQEHAAKSLRTIQREIAEIEPEEEDQTNDELIIYAMVRIK